MPEALTSFCEDFIDFEYQKRHKKGDTKYRRCKENSWAIDKFRLSLLLRIKELPIPKLSKEILSKLTINHQLKAIVSVVKIGRNSVTLHGKVNKSHRNYSLLESDNVIIKVFVHRAGNLLKPHEMANLEFAIMKIDHIVIKPMIGDDKPAPTLRQIMNWNRDGLDLILEEILTQCNGCWHSNISTNHILRHGGKWHFLDFHESNYYYINYDTTRYEIDVLKLFREFIKFGLSQQQLETAFFKVFPICTKIGRHMRTTLFAEDF